MLSSIRSTGKRLALPAAAAIFTTSALALNNDDTSSSSPLTINKRVALCHGGPHPLAPSDQHRIDELERMVKMMSAQLKTQFDVKQFSGQNGAVFSWDAALTDCFPADAKQFEPYMHSVFAENTATQEVYTGITGYGLMKISPDLKTWTRVNPTEPLLKQNLHGMTIFTHKNKKFIAMALNEGAGHVLITDLEGNVVQKLDAPKGGEFNFAEANAYYSKKAPSQIPWNTDITPDFAVTDVTFLNNKLYASTGYCPGDFVLTANFNDATNQWEWGPLAWGGKDHSTNGIPTPGKFKTAHGIFAHDNHIYVANRENCEIVQFTEKGELVRLFGDIPQGARVCNVSHAKDETNGENDYFVFNSLVPIVGHPEKTATVYAHSGDKVISEIQPGQLGIPILKNIHYVHPHYVTNEDGSRTLHLLLHGWSAGKYAVLKHEKEGVESEPNRCVMLRGGELEALEKK